MSSYPAVLLRRLRLRPLAIVAAGLVLVALDFRSRSVDFLPDVLGWLLVALGAAAAGARSAGALAAGAAVLSLSEWSLPYHYVRFDLVSGTFLPADAPGTGGPLHQRWDHVSQARGALIVAAMVVGALSVIVLVRTLARRARADGVLVAVRELRLVALLSVLWTAPFLVLLGNAVVTGGRYDPVWDGGAETGSYLAVLSIVAVATLLVLRRGRGWAFIEDPNDASRWRSLRASP